MSKIMNDIINDIIDNEYNFSSLVVVVVAQGW